MVFQMNLKMDKFISMECPRCKSNPKALGGHFIYPLCKSCMDIVYPDWDKEDSNERTNL